jgi:kynureninase
VREKSLALAELLINAIETDGGTGLTLASPRDGASRGSQVSFRHPEASAIMRTLASHNVIGDHRPPDMMRFGLTPLYTRYVDIWDAAAFLREVMTSREYLEPRFAVRSRVP